VAEYSPVAIRATLPSRRRRRKRSWSISYSEVDGRFFSHSASNGGRRATISRRRIGVDVCHRHGLVRGRVAFFRLLFVFRAEGCNLTHRCDRYIVHRHRACRKVRSSFRPNHRPPRADSFLCCFHERGGGLAYFMAAGDAMIRTRAVVRVASPTDVVCRCNSSRCS
jgi:hypothetical protein